MTEGFQASQPWWYRLLAKLWPSRCREIPEADNPTWCEHKTPITDHSQGSGHIGYCETCGAPARIVLRQFALIKRRCYLQQFACAEDPRYMHSHPAKYMIALGLWGSYVEHRIAGAPIERRAPYVYSMDAGHVHHVQDVSAGHTSIFLMLGLQHDDPIGDKVYLGAPVRAAEPPGGGDTPPPTTLTRSWKQHIRRKVARI